MPPLLDPFHLESLAPDAGFAVEIARRAPGPLVLFVGQILPHKRPELLVAAHHLLTSHHLPDATLALVGQQRFPDYAARIARFASTLNLPRVWMAPGVSDRQLAELYRRADVFVTASSHEGFCVPLVEAMAMSTPVVACPAGAVAETLGDGGLLLEEQSPESIAEALALVLTTDLGAELTLAGRRRSGEMGLEQAASRLRDFLGRRL